MSDRIQGDQCRDQSVNRLSYDQFYRLQFEIRCLCTGRRQIIVFTFILREGRLEVYNQERIIL